MLASDVDVRRWTMVLSTRSDQLQLFAGQHDFLIELSSVLRVQAANVGA
jgi:hypothetical protein